MISALYEFLVSSLVIVAAGTALVRASDRIAEETGLGRVFVGAVFLAGATSLPELTVDLSAIRLGRPDLAIGDLFGSSLFNLLILAVLDAARLSPLRAFGADARHHALSGILAILLTGWVGLGIAARGGPELLGAGLFAWGAVAFYLFGLRVLWLDQGTTEQRPALKFERGVLKPILAYAAAAAAILWAGPRLASAADHLALASGLGHTFIGTTAVALATSLPELVSTFTALRMGYVDLALGNIFGSNAFNMLLVLPLDFAMPGSFLAAVRPVHAVTALAVVVVTSVAVMGQVYRRPGRRGPFEPTAEAVAAMIVMFLYLLYQLKDR